MTGVAMHSLYRRTHPHGLMFHRFHADGAKFAAQGSLSPKQFEKILQFVGVDNILTPDEWVSHLQAGTLGPLDLCLTFDDGLRSQMNYAEPILAKYGLRAFWFVYSIVFEGGIVKSEVYSEAIPRMGGIDGVTSALLTQWPAAVDTHLKTAEFALFQRKMLKLNPFYTQQDCLFRFLRNSNLHGKTFEIFMDQLMKEHGLIIEEIGKGLWMDRDNLKFLVSSGHWVGLHSYSHPYAMNTLSYTAQKIEYQRNYSHLASLTGAKPRCMSHPRNAYNSKTLQILRSFGIECGFRDTMKAAPRMLINSSPLAMAREDSTTLLSLTQ